MWSSGAEASESHGYGSGDDTDSMASNGQSSINTSLAEPTWHLGKQSICDGVLEIVAVFGSWHLGQLTVGLSRAIRLRQGRQIMIKTTHALPMQIDGEPFRQETCEIFVERQSQVRVLRKVESEPLAAVVRVVEDVLEEASTSGIISNQQHDKLSRDLATRLHQL